MGKVNGTSHDCPFDKDTDVGNLSSVAALPIDLSNSTGTVALALTANSPVCSAAGFSLARCACDSCNTAATLPCSAHADCPDSGRCTGGTNTGEHCETVADCPDPSGACSPGECFVAGNCASGVCDTSGGVPGVCTSTAGFCGGSRCLGGPNAGAPCVTPGTCNGAPCGPTGEPTKPNACQNAVCSAVVGQANEGQCAGGPFPGNCGPTETFRGCTGNGNCMFPGDTCIFAALNCFLDNGAIGNSIVAQGIPDVPVNDSADPTLGATFCIAPVGASAINSAAGLPGAGRVTLNGTARGLPDVP
jgi:hypothetical protein